MPEIDWATVLILSGLVTGPVAVDALVHLWVSGRQYTRGRAEIDAITQATRAEIAQGFADTLRAMRQTAARRHHREEDPPIC